MKIDRRDIFKFAGGAAAGVVLTPLPWKLLDDSAIWTQNWPWIPKPLKGEIKTRFTTCTLCPAGCGVRARCVGEQPVSLAGIPAHPISGGALCPVGLGGHHLAYHPARVRKALHRGRPSTPDEAAKAVAKAVVQMKEAGSRQHIAIMDGRPGRIASAAYRQWLSQFPTGVYLRPVQREGATLEAVADIIGTSEQLGIDFENTRTLMSFGAPVLDGWIAPGRMAQTRERLTLIQAEPRQSHTALMADQWLALKPGTEAALALAIGHILIDRKLHKSQAASDFAAYASLTSQFTPELAARTTGLSPQAITDAAMALAGGGPAVVIGGADAASGPLGRDAETAIAALNLLLGSVGIAGGIVPRRDLDSGMKSAPVVDIASLPDGSIGVLIIDAASLDATLPVPLVKRKLGANPLVVSLSAFTNGYAQYSEYVVPAPAQFEAAEDVSAPFDSPAAAFAISAPLYPAPEGSTEPAAFLAKVSESAGLEAPPDLDTLRKARVEAIRKSGRGALFAYTDAQSKSVKDAGSQEDFWKALNEGACWVDDKLPAKPPARFSLIGQASFRQNPRTGDGGYPLALVPFGYRGGPAQSSPLMTKLYQESNLREVSGTVRLSPETAAANSLKDGDAAVVETPEGGVKCRASVDASVRSGVVEVAVAQAERSVLDICTVDADGTWRHTPARIRRA